MKELIQHFDEQNKVEKRIEFMNEVAKLNTLLEDSYKEIERLHYQLKLKEKRVEELERWKERCYGYGKEY